MKRTITALLFAILWLTGIAGAQVTTNPASTGVAASRGQLPGEPSSGSACAGCVGEFFSDSVASGSAVSLSTGTAKTVTSRSLNPGDWDVDGVVCYTGNAATTTRYSISGISTTNNTLGALGTFETTLYGVTATAVFALIDPCATVPTQRISISTATTVYLIATLDFSVNTGAAYGFIRYRRAR